MTLTVKLWKCMEKIKFPRAQTFSKRPGSVVPMRSLQPVGLRCWLGPCPRCMVLSPPACSHPLRQPVGSTHPSQDRLGERILLCNCTGQAGYAAQLVRTNS